jgi:hypothetical protein
MWKEKKLGKCAPQKQRVSAIATHLPSNLVVENSYFELENIITNYQYFQHYLSQLKLIPMHFLVDTKIHKLVYSLLVTIMILFPYIFLCRSKLLPQSILFYKHFHIQACK